MYAKWTRYFKLFIRFSSACVVLTSLTLTAQALDEPEGDVLLTIDGNITLSNAVVSEKPVAQFDLDLLKSLGVTSFATKSFWTEESHTYSGVRLNTLLKAVGVDHKNTTIRATAANGYWYDLQDLELDEYPIIVAYERDSKLLTLRERGPLWIFFPWDLYPELESEKNKASSVWQLITLTVQ